MRLFVAVWPSPEACGLLGTLDRPAHPLVRWTPLEQWHVTVRFFGDVADADVPGITDALRAVGERQPSVHVELGPATRRLGRSVLVVPVSGMDELGETVVDATRSFGDPPADRAFAAHVTLARARRGRPIPAELAGQPVAASWVVGELTLVRSHLDATDARYETLVSVSLAG